MQPGDVEPTFTRMLDYHRSNTDWQYRSVGPTSAGNKDDLNQPVTHLSVKKVCVLIQK